MAISGTADQGLIRKLNTAIILDELRRNAPLSRAELAARTGLNRSTVSIIINSLVVEGFVQETDLQSSKVGRPGMLLVLNPRGGFAIGVEIGVDFLSVILTDFIAQELWRKHICTDLDGDQITILEQAVTLTQAALERGQEMGLRPLGIGLGVPGLVDQRQGRLVFAPNLHWTNIPLRMMWSQRFGLPVFVENEANAAALGEFYFGAARGVDDFIYLSAGVGLGGGVMIGGKLFRGSSGYASEIGHMTIDPNGEPCSCGKRGCWETLVGPRAVLRRVRHTLESGYPSLLNQLVADDLALLTMDDVVNAARRDDSVALNALNAVAENLGIGAANLVNVFNPQLIVLGGALNLASNFLLPVMEQVMLREALSPASENIRTAPRPMDPMLA